MYTLPMNRFISEGPDKTPPMRVQVIDFNGQLTHTYDVPAGFQLDLYVQSLFPTAEFMVYSTHEELNVSVIIPENQDIYQIHRGVYRKDGT